MIIIITLIMTIIIIIIMIIISRWSAQDPARPRPPSSQKGRPARTGGAGAPSPSLRLREYPPEHVAGGGGNGSQCEDKSTGGR